jgi:hypothetical protein
VSKGRLSNSQRTTRRSSPVNHRFIGISLSGGKTDKTSLAVVEYFPEHEKIFLVRLFDRIKSDEQSSGDTKLFDLIKQYGDSVENVVMDAPLSLPLCLSCQLKCPGQEKCNESHISWLRTHYKKWNQKKRPHRIFTPYTERCVDAYFNFEMDEFFHLSHAMGANAAPLLARTLFLQKRMDLPVIEASPKLSLWRMGTKLKIAKSVLRSYRQSSTGEESRTIILKQMVEKNFAFIYQQDHKMLIDHLPSFEAFLCAMTGVFHYLGKVEDRPHHFPKEDSWIEIPKL